MRNFLKLAQGIHMSPLQQQLYRNPQLWKADTYLRDYPQGPFSDVETIFVRFPTASVSELERSQKDQHECVWMDGYIHLPAVRPLVFALMAMTEGERIGRVMLNKIRPGGRIYPHADTPVHAEYWERHHYCVQGAPGCIFRCGEETVQMTTGELWWFENALEHEVINNSADDRIHLIIDIRCSSPAVLGELPTKPA